MRHYEQLNAELEARALGERLRDASLSVADSEQMAAEKERLRRAISQTRVSAQPRRSRLPSHTVRWLVAAAVLLIVAGSSATFWQSARSVPLAFNVVGPGREGAAYVAAVDDRAALLKFTDGSTVLAHPGARLRVSELHSRGAVLTMERGKATFEVMHRATDTRWVVVAGPFSVTVTGTKFDLDWVPSAERLTVDMLDGQIEVNGPIFTAPATVRRGQRIEADTHRAKWLVTSLDDSKRGVESLSAAAADGEGDLPVEPLPPDEVMAVIHGPIIDADAPERRVESPRTSAARFQVAASSQTSPARTSSGHDASSRSAGAADADAMERAKGTVRTTESAPRPWSKLVASGESLRVVTEAESMGVRTCLRQCGSVELRALADAARYSGKLDLAEAALRALRDRFPDRAAVAAYLLGAVDEARGRSASALRWYDTYISTSPRGGFVSEAMAGRLRMLIASQGYTAARKSAQEYLERFPHGVGVGTARQVLEHR